MWYGFRVRRRKRIGLNPDFLCQDIAAAVACQIEICMVCQVAKRIPIRLRPVIDRQSAVCQCIGHLGLQRAGISFFTRRAGQTQMQAVRLDFRRPDTLVKAFFPSM